MPLRSIHTLSVSDATAVSGKKGANKSLKSPSLKLLKLLKPSSIFLSKKRCQVARLSSYQYPANLFYLLSRHIQMTPMRESVLRPNARCGVPGYWWGFLSNGQIELSEATSYCDKSSATESLSGNIIGKPSTQIWISVELSPKLQSDQDLHCLQGFFIFFYILQRLKLLITARLCLVFSHLVNYSNMIF